MKKASFPRLFAIFGVGLALSLSPLTAMAQSIDVPGDTIDGVLPQMEPTPIEEISPGSGSEEIPGTEPLYDKGITITQIEIEGNSLIPDETIIQAIDSRPGTLYSKRRLQNDLKKIYDTGYFTEKLRVAPVATRDGVHLKIEVEENPVVKEIQFDGNTELKTDELAKLFEGQVGKPQNANALNKAIQEIEETYKDKGYILARVEDIQEDTPGTVKLTISEGRVHSIDFSGNKKTKDFVIRRAMAQKEGEIYNEKTVNDDLKRIFGAQTFSDVRRVVKASAEAPGEYDLVVEVDEKKTGAISLGGGVDTGTGVFGSVGYNDPNFLGRGQNVSTVFSLGTGVLGGSRNVVTRRVLQAQVNWFNPSVAETTNSLGTSVYARDLASFNVPLAIEKRYGGQVTWGRPIESVPGLAVGSDLGFEAVNLREGVNQNRLDRFDISAAQRRAQLEDGSFLFLAPSVSYDTRDNRMNPSRGWLTTLTSRAAYGFDIDSYATLSTNIRRYLKITDSMTLALNTQLGGPMAGDVPAFNMFRLGGPYSIRGFQEGGIGIGEGYLLGSAEVRSKIPLLKRFSKLPLYDMVQAAVFMDGGTLFSEADTNDIFDRPGYGLSAGGGLRVNIPAMGPLRIDYAIPFGKTGGYTRNINFGVGQKF